MLQWQCSTRLLYASVRFDLRRHATHDWRRFLRQWGLCHVGIPYKGVNENTSMSPGYPQHFSQNRNDTLNQHGNVSERGVNIRAVARDVNDTKQAEPRRGVACITDSACAGFLSPLRATQTDDDFDRNLRRMLQANLESLRPDIAKSEGWKSKY